MNRQAWVGLAVLALVMLTACGDDVQNTITGPPQIVEVEVPIDPAFVAGAWESIFRTDNVASGVFSMTLIQEGALALGNWSEPTNGYTGTVNLTVTGNTNGQATRVVAFLTLAGCTGQIELRGDVLSSTTMTMDGPGFAASACVGVTAPQGIRLRLNKTSQ